MSPLALGLVILAAVCHAAWNLLTKGSRHQLTFLWWMGLPGTGLFLPAVAWTTPSWRWPAATLGGTLLGVTVLGERHPASRLVGASLILAGVLLLGLAGA